MYIQINYLMNDRATLKLFEKVEIRRILEFLLKRSIKRTENDIMSIKIISTLPLMFWGYKIKRKWKLHNENLNNFYASPDVFRIIKSRRTKWVNTRLLRMNGETGYKLLTMTSEKNPSGRPPWRWADKCVKEKCCMNCLGLSHVSRKVNNFFLAFSATATLSHWLGPEKVVTI